MTDILKSAISEILYEMRKEDELSQQSMAAKMCISHRQYNNLESGKCLMLFETFLKFAIVFGVDVNKFISDLREKGYTVDDDYAA